MSSKLSESLKLHGKVRPIAALTPYANNARKHPRNQIRKLGASLTRFGWTNAILIDADGNVICGHGRLEAAKVLGETHVPVVDLGEMSDEDWRAYILADNRLAEEAQWSKALLRSELKGLVEIGYAIEFTGFDAIEVDTMLSMDDAETADDDVELPPDDAVPVTRVGELWVCGNHRMIVGDARDPAVLDRLLDGELAQLVVTDPPFGNAIANNVSGNGKVKHTNFVMGSGETSMAEFGMTLLRPALKALAPRCAAGAIAFVFIDWRGAPHLLDAANGVFFEVKNLIVWAKTNGGQGAFYRSAHELIYAFKVNRGKHINNFLLGQGGRYRTNVWNYAGANVFRAGRMLDLADHPTVKPKKMIADAILDCSQPGGIVLDVFAGSGTTLSACAVTGRRGRAVELDPKFADVILRRIQQETGLVATLDGVPFDEVARERRAAINRED